MIPLLLALTCLPVDGPKLLAKHFAASIPEFGSVAPDLDLGYAPAPGAVRMLRSDELQHLARRHGVILAASAEPVCFEWQMAPLDETRALQAMRSVLPEGAKIEVKELSRGATPPGEVLFPLENLKAGFWRGHVRFNGNRRFDIWARVQISMRQTRVVAAVPLKSTEMLSAAQLRLEEFESEPDPTIVATLDQAIGKTLKAPVAAGSPIPARMLELPAAVLKGSNVRLRASAGAAQVTVEAHAQTNGHIGEIIPVKNTLNGRLVRAKVVGAGEVTWTP